MKLLTIAELKALQVGDWVWITNKAGQCGTYARKNVSSFEDDEFAFENLDTISEYDYEDYGTKWFAYKNKEQAEAKGEIVELPKEKWAITRGGGKECPNYLVEHRNPKAEFWGGKWHISMEQIEWRDVVEEYDTEQEAEYKLVELKEDTK